VAADHLAEPLEADAEVEAAVDAAEVASPAAAVEATEVVDPAVADTDADASVVDCQWAAAVVEAVAHPHPHHAVEAAAEDAEDADESAVDCQWAAEDAEDAEAAAVAAVADAAASKCRLPKRELQHPEKKTLNAQRLR